MADVDKNEVIQALQTENQALRRENEALKAQIESARGVLVEELIKEWTDGTRMNYHSEFDVMTKNGTRLEVKYSGVHLQKATKTKRWNWDSILGANGTKNCDYLVLAGSKDQSHEYPNLPYVIFLVPRDDVGSIMGQGNCVALNTNLDAARATRSVMLKGYMVRSQDEFEQFKMPNAAFAERKQGK